MVRKVLKIRPPFFLNTIASPVAIAVPYRYTTYTTPLLCAHSSVAVRVGGEA